MLGFDSNLIPNFNILVFQLYPGEDSEYSEESGRFACNSASSLGNTPNIREIHFGLVLFLAGYSRVYCKTSNTLIIHQIRKEKPEKLGKSIFCFFRVHYRHRIHQLFAGFGKKIRIIGKIIKRSSEMAKFAIPAQEISENSEKSL